MFYTTPKATEALIITGGMKKRDPERPFKVVVGSGAWYIPFYHRVNRFNTDAQSVSFQLTAQSKNNVEIIVSATVVFSIESTEAGIIRAAKRFLNYDQERIKETAADVFEGATRGLIGGLSVEEIINDRMTLAADVVEAVQVKMTDFGWRVDSFQINSITDENNHIRNLSRPELTRVEELAAVAEAQSAARIQDEEQKSKRIISEYQKETDIRTSQNIIDTAKARAEAEQSGPLAQAREQLIVRQEETKLARAESELKEAEYEASIVKKAEAEAKKTQIEAKARAEAIRLDAEALASENSVALEDKMIEQLPQIIESLGKSIAGSNLTILGNDEDIISFTSKLAASGTMVLNELRKAVTIDHEEINKTVQEVNKSQEKPVSQPVKKTQASNGEQIRRTPRNS